MSNFSAVCPGDYSIEPFLPATCVRSPDLSITFEEVLLGIVPSCIALLAGSLRFHFLRFHRLRPWHQSGWLAIKTACLGALAISDLMVLVLHSHQSSNHASLGTAALAMQLICSVGTAMISLYEHRRTLRPSILLQTYLLSTLIFNAVRLRTIVRASADITTIALWSADVSLRLLALLLESWHIIPIDGEQNDKQSPEDSFGLFGLRFFWWLNGLFWKGYRETVQSSGLFDLSSDVARKAVSQAIADRILGDVSMAKTSSRYGLGFALLRDHLSASIIPIIPKLLYLACQFSQPFLINKLLHVVQSTEAANTGFGPGLAVLFGAAYLGSAVFNSWYWQTINQFNTRVQGSLLMTIYSKLLRWKPGQEGDSSPLTLITVDVQTIASGLRVMHEFWSSIVAIAVGLWLLYNQVGLAFLAPLVVVFLVTIVSSYLGSKVRTSRLKFLRATQNRVRFTETLIERHKIIKFLGISSLVEEDTQSLRSSEIGAQQSYRRILIGTISLAQSVLGLSSLATFGAYAVIAYSNNLGFDTQKVFTTLAVLKLFTSPLLETIQYIATFISALASLERVQTYLQTESNVGFSENATLAATNRLGGETLDLQTLYSHSGMQIAGFQSVNNDMPLRLVLAPGTMTIVNGRVGSGKTTFLRAVLDAFTSQASRSGAKNTCGYCPQDPWIWNGSVRENIIGPSLFLADQYETVVSACDLRRDINCMAQQDDTLLGSCGASLSGGQRKRIALARAVYAKPSLLILDDPFAGLDQTTEQTVFGRLFGSGGLLKSYPATVLLSSHNSILAAGAERIISIDEHHRVQQIFRKGATGRVSPSLEGNERLPPHAEPISMQQCGTSAEESQPKYVNSPVQPTNTLVEHSNVKVHVRRFYLRSIGWPTLLVFLGACAVWVTSTVMQSITLQRWAQLQEPIGRSLRTYLPAFAAVSLSTIVFVALFLWFTYERVCPRASMSIHNHQLRALMRASLSFMSKVDHGSIINRFSQDLSLIDGQLASSFVSLVMLVMNIIAQTGILIATVPFIAVLFPVVGLALWGIQNVYLRTARQIRVLDIEAKAPLAALVAESAAGLVIISSFEWTEEFRAKFARLTTDALKPFYLLGSIQNWLNCVLDLTVAGIAVLLAGLVVALRNRVNTGLLGLALTGLMDFGFYFRELVTEWTQVEASLGAVQRVQEFAHAATADFQPRSYNMLPPQWPSRGRVEIDCVSATYSRDGPTILKDISMSIPHGTKVAICGRTGSGKSSLVSLLLGLINPTSGFIKIDGIDTSMVNPQEICSGLCVLPQHELLLPGTIRRNLLPATGQDVTDRECARVLRKIGLWKRLCQVSSISEDSPVAMLLSGGAEPLSSMSQGEQQLFCLARAILKGGNVLILDEATSNVDSETEATMIEAIHAELDDSTIIAIAHRLDTIIDYDIVVVMDEGRIVERGSPRVLLSDRRSSFSRLYHSGS